ncbi:hypothetical protein LUZ63_013097 [Rhynchospora breviuscula]|uniref:Uncharacterized protein n=1 Tax=Rhynchospora breviuscula TaxID=2022672 RepID=A0A9Q0C827_9POAL|nr:hypothetical protein LUZ63_013097 [Rhynchospora breviuscula]
MQFKKSVEEWLATRDSEIWKTAEGNKIMASLKLSYMNLSSQLKECFAYCSIFPKGHVIYKQELIGQWMANGLVSFTRSMRDTKIDLANECFEQLVQVSFLQNVEHIYDANVTCNMHDLVYDLAQSISDQRIFLISDTKQAINEENGEVNPTKIKKMRALHISGGNSSVVNMISKAQSLRSLYLERIMLLRTLPISITKLIHLRYICILDCQFTTIPNDIGSLWSLEALHLRDCDMITYLPKSIGKLIYLRILELNNLKLKHLPESIGQCQSLQNLIISNSQITSIPNSLGQLVNLKFLNIFNCSELKCLPESIGNLTNLESLNLPWCRKLNWLPESISNLVNLRFLDIHDCKNLEKVPKSIGQLINLESLNLSWCRGLKCLRLDDNDNVQIG